MKVLGVRIDKVTRKQALEKVGDFLNSDGQYKIFTPNPEMLVDAQKDEYFKEVLNKGDLNICDGFGLSVVSGVKKISGVDFMVDICALAEETWRSVYLLGSGSDEILEKVKSSLKKSFPNLKVVGIDKGPVISDHGSVISYDREENNELVADIVMTSPDILFVAFGHGKQEKWIEENLKQLPSVKVAMGVGGSFDFISGGAKRAPKFLRKIGLEWLFRLILQPKRIKRIWKATFKFIFLIIFKNRTQI